MDIVRQVLAIGFVLALLWAALWLLRRKGALNIRMPSSARDRTLLESRAKLNLSEQHSLHVSRADDRQLVVDLHRSGVSLLCDRPITAAPLEIRERA